MAPQPTNADLRVAIAVLQRDITENKADIAEIRKELATFRSYFVRFLFGIGSLFAAAVAKWVFAGGLAGTGG